MELKNIAVKAGPGRGTYQINWNRKRGIGYWYRHFYDPTLGHSRAVREDPPGWDGPKGITEPPTKEQLLQIEQAIKITYGNGAPKVQMDEMVREGVLALFQLFNDIAELPQVGPEVDKWAEAHPSKVVLITNLEAMVK